MEKTLQDRLRKLISDRDLSIAEAEKECGLSKDTLRKLLKNELQSPNSRTLSAIAKGFNVAEQWLLHGESPNPESVIRAPSDARVPTIDVPTPYTAQFPRDVPVHGTAAGSHNDGSFQIFGTEIDYVRRPPALIGTKNIYALYVEGTSMEQQFNPGDLIYVHPHKPARAGDPVVIQTAGEHEGEIQATIGIYLRKTEKGVTIGKHNPKAEILIAFNGPISIHKILSLAEMFGI